MTDEDQATSLFPQPKRKRVAVRVAEIVLILVIIGLLVAIWMPGFYGAKGPLR